MSTPNLYAEQARRRKAATLADYCRAEARDVMLVGNMSPEARALLCERAGVNEASDETWTMVMALLVGETHETFVTEGGLSNFTVTCVCGRTWGVATFSREFAERSGEDHVHAFSPSGDVDPFANL